MIKITCPRCTFQKGYEKLALPAGDLRYWKCPECGWQQMGSSLKPICDDDEPTMKDLIKSIVISLIAFAVLAAYIGYCSLVMHPI